MHRKYCLALALAFCTFVASGVTLAVESPDVLASSREVTLTRGDYEAALAKIPEDKRIAFASSATRLTSFLNNLLVTKTLAERARKAGLQPEPGMSLDTPYDIERAYATAEVRRVDSESERAFDANLAGFAAAARENYVLDANKYVRPEQVRLSAILIATEGRGGEAALALAKATRDKLGAWADFAAVAKASSDDKASAAEGGDLGWRSADQLDPELAKIAFALRVGEVSQPILQPNGYALIRVDERRPAGKIPFDEAKPEIMARLRADYLNRQREVIADAIRNDPTLKVNQPALDSLVQRVDPTVFGVPPSAAGSVEPTPAAR